jgi:hypothetical protein
MISTDTSRFSSLGITCCLAFVARLRGVLVGFLAGVVGLSPPPFLLSVGVLARFL